MKRLALCAVGVALGCIGTPRFMHAVDPASPRPARDPAMATVVFIRNGQPCETGGSYVIVDGEGRFLSNLSFGTRSEVAMAPGEHLIVAWNPDRERSVGLHAPVDVAVAQASLLAGRVYYLHLAFPPERLPPRAHERRWSGRSCTGIYRHMELLAVAPGSPGWNEVSPWTNETHLVTPDAVAGQEYLDSDPASVSEHIDIAVDRLQRMSERDLELRSLSPESGASW
jgi:hypothetical protein